MTDWFVGQKVQCIDGDSLRHSYPWLIFPVTGNVYIIRGIDTDRLPRMGCVGFLLEEVRNLQGLYLWARGVDCAEPSFGAWRFRPLVDTKTDISLLERLLDPVAPKVKEFA